MKRNIMEAYAEIDILLNYVPKEYKDEIPIELQDMFRNKKSLKHKPNISINNPFDKQKLKRETLVILAILQYNFWYKTNEEKERFKTMLVSNEIKYQNKLKEEYNVDDIFKNKKYAQKDLKNTNLPIPINKKTIYQRIIDCIKDFLKI